jgi:hypothetical protein
MNTIFGIILAVFALVACQQTKSDLELVQQYYKGLNNGDYQMVADVIGESLIMRENQDNFEVAFNTEEFHKWFQWDSVFNPIYEIKPSQLVNDTLRIAVTKTCDRILLFHEAPITFLAYFEISNGRINAINRYDYLDTDWAKWIQNREDLIVWINGNHPHLNGFMNRQDKLYAERFASAIKLFKTSYK